jgi:hypothetical protein
MWSPWQTVVIGGAGDSRQRVGHGHVLDSHGLVGEAVRMGGASAYPVGFATVRLVAGSGCFGPGGLAEQVGQRRALAFGDALVA